MADTKRRILISVLVVLLTTPLAFTFGSHKSVTCEEAAKNAFKIKVGMRESEVRDLLGPPKIVADNRWSYSFDCVSRPPRAGETTIIGLDIVYVDGLVKEIKRAWMDATGTPKPTNRKHQRRGKAAA